MTKIVHLFLLSLAALVLTGCSAEKIRNSTHYPSEYQPPRQYESSVLNEPDDRNKSSNAGRGYRIGGSGYGPERGAHTAAVVH